jgi:hypothetical protein
MSYYQEFNKNLKAIDNVAFELQHLSHAFRDTGNQYMYQILLELCDDLQNATKNITNIDAEESTKRLKHSEEMSYNIFAACVKPYLDNAIGE